jgi:Phage tail sheath C-terminal domain
MAQLQSPGISVTVVDESFYIPAAPGTVPLIVVATQANKMNSAGTGIAPGTLAANAGTVYLLTSQSDLGAVFGVPYFQTDAENNPVNAGELNEYGLQAAYSFLGVSGQAYVVRANVDTSQLIGTATIPAGLPANNTYWWDTSTTSFGVFQWNANPITATNGQSFVVQTPAVIGAGSGLYNTSTFAPLPSFGSVGSYAVVTATTLAQLWYKQYNTANDGTGGTTVATSTAGTWVQVGSTAWTASMPTATSTVASTAATISSSDTLIVNGYTVTGATTYAGLVTALGSHVSGVTASVINGYLNIYSTGVNVVLGGTLTSTNKIITGGTYYAPAVTIAPHYQVPNYGSYTNSSSVNGYPTGSIWIKTTPVNQGANFDIELYNSTTASWIRQSVAALYASNQAAMAALDPVGGGVNIPVGQVYVKYNDDEITSPTYVNFKIYQRLSTGTTSSTSAIITSSTFGSSTFTFALSSSQVGSATLPSYVTVTFTTTGNGTSDANALSAAINSAVVSLGNVVASVTASNQVVITHTQGGDIRIQDGTNLPIGKIFTVGTNSAFYADPSGTANYYIITAWASANSSGTALVTPSATAPTTLPTNGQLWYNSSISDVDILVNDGSHWRGYASTAGKVVVNQGVGFTAGYTQTDSNGPIISATQPTTNSQGGVLQHGDLWINSSNIEAWPIIYRWNFLTKAWVLINNTDHTTTNGIVFADARWSDETLNPSTAKTGADTPDAITTLLTSDFVDFDAPNAQLYPKGTLLFNLRRSSFNVKKYVSNYVNTQAYNTNVAGNPLMTFYYPDRWVSDAANDYLGRGVFGRKAQRAVVVQALNALIQSNQQIRNEDSVTFDLISCPGYLETTPALISLNNDRGLLSFIIADAPARLPSDATSLTNWGHNVNQATGDGEIGLVSTDANTGVYYPWGYTTDLYGNNIVVPPSHIMLRTIALSDNVAYPWFAPAGVRRGGVTNASSVGYVDATTGEYNPIALNNGQRDALAAIHVNPITYIGGVGLVAYGQKTRQLVASSLDRINVARLVIYLRYQLNAISKPYVFEPNDTITRNEIKQEIEKLLLNLTAERALYDYLVVCDTSNNTPSRIDANELYVDIAIEPVKSIEFIYIPLRLENTGAIAGLGKK